MTAMPVHPQIQQVIDALAASEFGPIHGLTPAQAREQYERMVQARGIAPAPVGAVEDRAIPGAAGDLPAALVLTAQCDVLHDEGEAYARRLRAAGVDVEYRDCEGMIHGFFAMAPMVDGAVRAQALVCEAMKRVFARVA